MTDEALLGAVTGGDVAALRALLERDPALADIHDDKGVSMLLLALYHDQPAARDALLAAGATVGVPEAAALGDVERLREHLASDPEAFDARGGDGFTALHLAAFFGGAQAVRLLLGAGAPADADAENPLRVRPLHSASAVGDSDAARALLEAGADPNARQQGGFTPLHAAAHNDDVALTRLLLDHGADPALANDDGQDSRALAGERVAAVLAERGS